jgi:circadian clock protein KaiA
LQPQLSIGTYLTSAAMAQAVTEALSRPEQPDSAAVHYRVTTLGSPQEFCKFIEQEKQYIDCLILQQDANLPNLVNWLHGQAALLPALILMPTQEGHQSSETLLEIMEGTTTPNTPAEDGSPPHFTYHVAEVPITAADLSYVDHHIQHAIARFIALSPTCRITDTTSMTEVNNDLSTQNFLLHKQRRLTEKLKERLGYLGVYFKRNPQNFLRHLSPEDKQELLEKLRTDYRDIVLCYFLEDGTLNQRIDDFVNIAFFTDVPTSQIVEIHMDLMDEFSKQLKLEGRSEEILLDYRLTLIDVIAHLCEMYRRSIPGNLKDENL